MHLNTSVYELEGGARLWLTRTFESDVVLGYTPGNDASEAVRELESALGRGIDRADLIGGGLRQLVASIQSDPTNAATVPLAVGAKTYALEDVRDRLEKRYGLMRASRR